MQIPNENEIEKQIREQAAGGMVNMNRAVMFGTGPLEHEELQARFAECQRSKQYMVAVWSLVNGEINYSAVTNRFPTEDIEPCLKQFTDSCKDFMTQTMTSPDIVLDPETPVHDSGVKTKKRKHDNET